MPPKPRIIRKPTATDSANSPKPVASIAHQTDPSSPTKTSTSNGTGSALTSKEGAMLPPPDPSPPKAILEPELDALAVCLRVTVFLGLVFVVLLCSWPIERCCQDEPSTRVLR
jgi:hypothetical protein